MTTANKPSQYAELVQRTAVTSTARRPAQEELDSLVQRLGRQGDCSQQTAEAAKPDHIDSLRKLTKDQLISVFDELAQKYTSAGIAMQFDPSDLLAGGRAVKFYFRVGEYRLQLNGTVTSDVIAFTEEMYTPICAGKLSSGAMLRMRGFTADRFREFVCERLGTLLKSVIRRS